MRYVCFIIGAALLIFFVLITIRYFLVKKQIRLFTAKIKEKTSTDSRETLKIFISDNDLSELADAVNKQFKKQDDFYASYLRDKEKTDYMVSGISHDFRTPLTSSIGYLQLLKKSGEIKDPKNTEYLDTVIEKNKYMKKLSDDFFDIAKMGVENNKERELVDCNISGLLETSLLQFYDRIESKNMELTADIQKDIILKTDEHDMTRIFDNLLSNSIKYGMSKLKVRLRPDHLEVINDMQDKDLDVMRVFEPFYRSDSRSNEGSGLGLYIVKCLCDDMGYSINVDKVEGFICFRLSFN